VTIHSFTVLLHVFFAFMLWRSTCQQKCRQQNASVSMNVKSTINWNKQESEVIIANKLNQLE